MSKKKNKPKGVVYSTNPDFEFKYENNQAETLPAKKQKDLALAGFFFYIIF